ncbi:MAG: TonB-dependent receptor [Pseudomonadota bacterium]
MRGINQKGALFFAASAHAVLIATGAAAQEAERRALDTIVVTAEKTAENLQDVPASITAFPAAALETKRIVGIENIAEFVPSLYSTPSAADVNGQRLFIRGIGTFDPQLGQDARVAIYVDGIYLGKTQGLTFDSPDLERIEVLKGPQGTLYGRNSVAGAINLISARPNGDAYSGNLSVDYGSFNTVRARGAVNIPLADDAGLRLSTLYSRQDGWVENNGAGTDFGGFQRWGGRAAIAFDLWEGMAVDIAADYTRAKNQTVFYQAVADTATPTSLFASAINAFDGRQDEVTTVFENAPSTLDTWGSVLAASYDWSDDDNIKLTAGWRRSESNRFVTLIPDASPDGLNAILAADLDNDPSNGVFSLNSYLATAPFILGVGGIDVRPDYADLLPRTDVDSIFASVTEGQPTLDDHEQFSVELTATGSFWDSRIDYVVGLYYFNEDTANTRTSLVQNPRDTQDVLFLLAGLEPFGVGFQEFLAGNMAGAEEQAAILGDIFGSAVNSAGAEFALDTSAFAAYSRLTWNITDRLRLTGGLRFSTEERDAVQQVVSPYFGDTINLLGEVIAPNIADNSFDSIDPAVIIEYNATDEVLVYASRKESFRAGGFNSVAVAPNLPGETFGADFVFDKEEITAYELGVKGDFFDGRVRVNTAGFYYNFDNEQATVQTNPIVTTQRAVVNVDSEIWGGELEALWLAAEGLTLSANYTFTAGDPGNPINPVSGAENVREQLPGAPRNSFSIGADYTRPVTDTIGFFGNVNYSYNDSTLVTPQDVSVPNPVQVELTNRSLLSLRTGLNIEMANGNTANIAFWAQNLLDDEYTIDAIDFSSFAFVSNVFGTPRTLGFSAGVTF